MNNLQLHKQGQLKERNMKTNKILLILACLLLVLALNVVSSIEITPDKTTLNFEPGLHDEISEGVVVMTTQLPAVIGQPVKWKKSVNLDSVKKVKIDLPAEADSVSVSKVDGDVNFTVSGGISEVDDGNFIVRFLERVFSVFTGNLIQEVQNLTDQFVEIDDVSTEYDIEYETPAPYTIEEQTKQGKKIKLAGSEKIIYENVLTFTELDETLNIKDASKIKIKWVEQDKYIPVQKIEDKDNNGVYDYVEWISPSSDNQTYEIIIEIIKAEHLDENREFISGIYDEVYQLDDVWSEVILAGHYVRVTFEQLLDNTRDITLYPRVVSGKPRIQVYEIDGTELIAEFTNLNENEYNKIYLTELVGVQDTFDLRVVGGSLEFDYIVDPLTTLFYEDWEAGNFDDWDNTAWTIASGEGYGSTDGGKCASEVVCDMGTIVSLDTSYAENINISFWYMDDDLEGGDAQFYFNDSSGNWILIDDAGPLNAAEDTWLFYSYYTTSSAYFHAGFAVRFLANPEKNENYWIDNINITAYLSNIPPTISGLPDASDDEDFGTNNSVMDLWDYSSDSEDLDADLTYAIESESNTSVVDCDIYDSHFITCTSQINVSGFNDVNVSVTDTDLGQDTDVFRFTVDAVNDQPWVDGLSDPANLTFNSGLNEDVISSTDIDNNFRDIEDDQSPTTVVILSETHTEIVDCELDGHALDCTTQTDQNGISIVTLNYTDSEGLSVTDSISISITPDTTNPNINIIFPINNTIYTNKNLDVNYTVSDANLDSCWYSNDTLAVNTSLGTGGSCTNITGITWTEGQHNVTVWANDSSGNENSSHVTFTIDTTPPTYSNILKNDSEVYQYEWVEFNTTWYDDTSLNYSIFSTNVSGSWANASAVSMNGASSYTASNNSYIDAIPGTLVGWRFYANDSVGNLNQTLIQTFTVGGVIWNQTSLDLGSILNKSSVTGVMSLKGYLDNADVSVDCYEGDCSVITTNFTTIDINDASASVTFNCSSSINNSYSANFSVSSTQDIYLHNLSVSCVVINGIKYDEFKGKGLTSNLDNIVLEDESVELILDDAVYARIKWHENVTLNSSYNLDYAIDYSYAQVIVDSAIYPNLDAAANVSMYNLNLGYPKILKDGVECGDCEILSWDTDTGSLTFNVSSFTTYTAVEANQSKIQNNGTTNASIYLLIKVQYFDDGVWIDDDVVVNETISSNLYNNGSYIKLDALFNGKWNTSANASNGDGTYRVYAAATDENDVILQNVDGENISVVYNFSVSGLSFSNVAPNNPSPSLVSVDGLNLTMSDLNCSALITDNDTDDEMDVSVRWFKNDVLNLTLDYNNSYSNATMFSAILESGNTSKTENWTCSLRLYDGDEYSDWVNSSGLEILNTLPVVTLVSPVNYNITTNRTPEFSWSGSDDDGDSLTYQVNVSLVADDSSLCFDAERDNDGISVTSYIADPYLVCLKDYNDYYNWSVRASDDAGDTYGEWTEDWKIEIQSEVIISLPVYNINFGSLGMGETRNTTGGSPAPFEIQNDGNCLLNISLNATDLWTSIFGNSSYYQFKFDNHTLETGAFNWVKTQTDWYSVPNSTQIVMVELNWSDANDSAEMDLLVTVPPQESAGDRSSILHFTAELGE